jgi:hypothetical protein
MLSLPAGQKCKGGKKAQDAYNTLPAAVTTKANLHKMML